MVYLVITLSFFNAFFNSGDGQTLYEWSRDNLFSLVPNFNSAALFAHSGIIPVLKSAG